MKKIKHRLQKWAIKHDTTIDIIIIVVVASAITYVLKSIT